MNNMYFLMNAYKMIMHRSSVSMLMLGAISTDVVFCRCYWWCLTNICISHIELVDIETPIRIITDVTDVITEARACCVLPKFCFMWLTCWCASVCCIFRSLWCLLLRTSAGMNIRYIHIILLIYDDILIFNIFFVCISRCTIYYAYESHYVS